MGDIKAKKASRNMFSVRADLDYNDGIEYKKASHRFFTDEDEARVYAEKLIAEGVKGFKTKEPHMPEVVYLEVYDVNGKLTDSLTCEATSQEIVKPIW